MHFIDVEATPNWFYVGVLTPEGEHLIFHEPKAKIRKILKNEVTVGFNSLKYDLAVIQPWLDGADPKELWKIGNAVIKGDGKWWDYYDEEDFNHIDLREPAPGVMVSLKLYMARLHAKKIDDLFHDQSNTIDPKSTYAYNLNDLIGTKMLYEAIKHEIDLREYMGDEYKLDLRSRGGAQIAERVLVKMTGYRGGKPNRPSFVRYKAPKGRIKFKSKELRDMLKRIEAHRFEVNEKGSVVMPEWLGKKHPVVINGREYTMGIGGLHSVNKTEIFNDVVDIDGTSFYPSMIIVNKWYPQHIGRSFFETYEKIYHDRVEAKKAGDKQKSNSLKLVLNSTFGLTGSRFSKLYAPDLMLAVTLTGQLQLLDLIEKFERKGIRVVSANTDGISVQGDLEKMRKIYRKWEKRTSINLEETHYKTLAMESVNSYVAVLTDGTVKAKGDYAEPGLNKNPEYPIVYEAVREYLAHDTPIEDTIRNCKDIRKFLTVRTVNGGAVYYEDDSTIPFVEGMTAAQVRETYGITMAEIKRREKARAERVVEGAGTHLGRVVRWVYTTKDCGTIHYAKNGNKVPNSDRCRPFQVLPKKNKTPKDLDYDRYIRIAFKKLKLVGAF